MRIFISVILVSILNLSYAQTTRYAVKVSGNSFFVLHKVQPKENWYSIGRIYEISPKEIAPFNGTTLESGLRIGQELKVPLVASNFDQESEASSGPAITYIVDAKETLYHIASEFGISVDKLKKWNGLKSDQVKPGVEVIIGFIHATGVSATAPSQTAPSVAQKQENPQPIVKQAEIRPVQPAAKQPESKDDVTPKQNAKPVVAEKITVPPVTTVSRSNGSIGYFASVFQQQSKEGKEQGLEGFLYGFFKSTSGWEDQKYYVLLNDVVPGTIVKISVRGTEKSIYAKVLGSVPAGKESEGMSMRMSNASSAALGIEDTSASLILVWYK